jgi:hypothetical protein
MSIAPGNKIRGGYTMKWTVFHDGQFWVGVLEEQVGNRLKAARTVFGGEPQDAEILHFVHHHAWTLLERSTGVVAAHEAAARKVNPKRLARLVAKERKKALAEKKREIAIRKAKARHRGC